MNEEREITREELYKLIWSKSLVLAAEGLGISDVGLAKICRRLNVPRPYRGYWARLARRFASGILSGNKRNVVNSRLSVNAKSWNDDEGRKRNAATNSTQWPHCG